MGVNLKRKQYMKKSRMFKEGEETVNKKWP